MLEICERKVIKSKIKHSSSWSRNVTIDYCAGCCMSASSLTGKPASFEWVSIPFVDKVQKKGELLLFGRNMSFSKH